MNSSIVSSRAGALTPYVAGEQPQNRKYIKLNTNESPYPPPPSVSAQLRDYDTEGLRLYPDPQFTAPRRVLAERYSLDPEEVFFGNGSDEILSFAFFAFFDPDNGPVLFPEHTYSFYPVYCTFYGLSSRRLPLRKDFSINLDDYLDVQEHAGVIIANPNAPTGISIDRRTIESFLRSYRSDRICIIDEAYVDFGAESCTPLIRDFPNLLLVHTFSKSRCLAGLRVGFALGDRELIRTLFTVKDSFNSYPLNRMTQDIACTVLQEEDYFREIRGRIIETRGNLTRRLTEAGWEVLPSGANFIFARLPGLEGEEIYRRLKAEGILVRHFSHRGIEDFIRITIGTDEDMETFFTTLQSLGFIRR